MSLSADQKVSASFLARMDHISREINEIQSAADNPSELHLASLTGDEMQVQKLLMQSLPSNDDKGRTPLHYAVCSESEDEKAIVNIIHILTKAGYTAIKKSNPDDTSRTSLHFAVVSGCSEMVLQLLECINLGESDGEKRKIEGTELCDQLGRTPLHYVSQGPDNEQSYEICKMLLNSTLFLQLPLIQDKYLSTALHLAVDDQNESVVCALVENDDMSTYMDRKDIDGIAPLSFSYKNKEIENILIDKGPRWFPFGSDGIGLHPNHAAVGVVAAVRMSDEDGVDSFPEWINPFKLRDDPFKQGGEGLRQQINFLDKWLSEKFEAAMQEEKDELLLECWTSPIIMNVDMLKFLVIFGANATNLPSVDDDIMVQKWGKSRKKCLEYYEFKEFLETAKLAWKVEHGQEPMISSGSTSLNTQKLFALSLDGGGIRGLASAFLLRIVSNRMFGDEKIKDRFHWMAGTSTGAIIALGLIKQESLLPSGCMKLYWDLKNKVFLKKSRKSANDNAKTKLINFSKTAARWIYSNPPVKQSENLESHLRAEFKSDSLKSRQADWNGTEEHIPRVSVLSLHVSQKPEKVHVFRNYPDPFYENGQGNVSSLELWQVARASSAAPLHFMPCEIENIGVFLDGGIGNNDPSCVLQEEMLAFIRKDFERNGTTPASISGMLSIGTGKPRPMTTNKLHLTEKTGFFDTLKKAYSAIRSIATVVTSVPGAGINNRPVEGANGELYAYKLFRLCPEIDAVHLDETDSITLIDMLWQFLEYSVTESTVNMIDQFAKCYADALRNEGEIHTGHLDNVD